MSPRAHIFAATLLTGLRVGLILVMLVDWVAALILWLPRDAPFPTAWVAQALAAAAGYVIASILFWMLHWVPVRRS